MIDWIPSAPDPADQEVMSLSDLKAKRDAIPPFPADYDWDLELDWSAVGDVRTCNCGFDDCKECFPDEF